MKYFTPPYGRYNSNIQLNLCPFSEIIYQKHLFRKMRASRPGGGSLSAISYPKVVHKPSGY
jgi:hypothetical protein